MALQTADDRTRAALAAAATLLVAGAAVLSGCVQQRAPAPPGQTAKTEPGMGFSLNRTEEEGWKLAYGQANTDNVELMLECKPGSRKIEVFPDHAKARTGDILTLSSGKVQSALPVSVKADDGSNDGTEVVAHATPDVPALDGFRRTGFLTVKLGKRVYALTATQTEKAQIARFFSGCERK